MNAEFEQGCLTIGYFGIRGKAQVCRLLCEYLKLPYQDRYFTPEAWEKYQQEQAKEWIIKGLPFIKDGNFVVTGQQGMCQYIVRKANSLTLLGSTARDRIKLDMFKSKYDTKDNIIALICQLNRSNSKDAPQKSVEYYWEAKIQPKLLEIERSCRPNDWFLGYLTIADFHLYETMNIILWFLPAISQALPNLMNLRERLVSLESIAAYQNSDRAVKIYNPVCYYKQFESRLDNQLSSSSTK